MRHISSLYGNMPKPQQNITTSKISNSTLTLVDVCIVLTKAHYFLPRYENKKFVFPLNNLCVSIGQASACILVVLSFLSFSSTTCLCDTSKPVINPPLTTKELWQIISYSAGEASIQGGCTSHQTHLKVTPGQISSLISSCQAFISPRHIAANILRSGPSLDTFSRKFSAQALRVIQYRDVFPPVPEFADFKEGPKSRFDFLERENSVGALKSSWEEAGGHRHPDTALMPTEAALASRGRRI